MFVYKIDVLRELKDAGYNNGRLVQERLFGQGDIQKMREHKVVGLKILDRLCQLLEMQPGGIIKYIPDEEYQKRLEEGTLQSYEIILDKRRKKDDAET